MIRIVVAASTPISTTFTMIDQVGMVTPSHFPMARMTTHRGSENASTGREPTLSRSPCPVARCRA